MAIERREFLAALALAPAALAACAGASAGSRQESRGEGTAPSSAAPEGSALATVRSFPLAGDVEPAFVFRAAPARPGEP
jgi:hypothetical protein